MEIGANIYRSVQLSRLRLNITIVSNLAYRSLMFSKAIRTCCVKLLNVSTLRVEISRFPSEANSAVYTNVLLFQFTNTWRPRFRFVPKGTPRLIIINLSTPTPRGNLHIRRANSGKGLCMKLAAPWQRSKASSYTGRQQCR